MATQRGGIALLYEGHRYNKVRDGKEGTVYWRCARDRQCPGRAVTVYSRIKKANNKHNHPPDAWRNKVDQVVSDLKLRAQDDATTLPTLFTETLKYLASSHQVAALASVVPTFPNFKSTICKPRHQLVPSLLQLRDFRPEDNWLYANSMCCLLCTRLLGCLCAGMVVVSAGILDGPSCMATPLDLLELLHAMSRGMLAASDPLPAGTCALPVCHPVPNKGSSSSCPSIGLPCLCVVS